MVQVPSSKETILIGDVARVVQRYAGALYDLAQEQSLLETVAADIEFLRVLFHESSEFQHIVCHPHLTNAQSAEALKKVADVAKLNPLTERFLDFLSQKQRLNFLQPMLVAFLERFATQRGEVKAEVCSARPLTGAQQEALARKLQQLTGGKVHLSLSQDAGLLGGLRVKMGSKLIDATIKTKLARLERQLKSEQSITQEGAV